LIVGSVLAANYVIATRMLRHEPIEDRHRQLLFALGLALNVSLLCFFKYTNYIAPLGISFLSFQNVAFLADVYSGEITAVRCTQFILFSVFFARATAGPIVRYAEFVPELSTTAPTCCLRDICAGVCLFSVGLFKKAVIADSLVDSVTPLFDPSLVEGPLTLLTAWVGMFAYALQLYFDFSGYSDMALGCSLLLGIRLPMNFNSPFKATSIIEFWSRWHMSLTRFLTHYVYNPIVLYLTRRRLLAGGEFIAGAAFLDWSNLGAGSGTHLFHNASFRCLARRGMAICGLGGAPWRLSDDQSGESAIHLEF
jgi:alginate O-acetyltransferase complex protein AlgI